MRGLVPICCLFILSACFDQGDCLVTNSTLVRVSLKSSKTRKDTTFTFTSVSVLNGKEIQKDKSLAFLELPVNPGATETSFLLAQATRRDTLTFQYRNETIILSPDCGAFSFQKDVTATKNTLGIDSIRWINRQLFKSVKSNAEIYF